MRVVSYCFREIFANARVLFLPRVPSFPFFFCAVQFGQLRHTCSTKKERKKCIDAEPCTDTVYLQPPDALSFAFATPRDPLCVKITRASFLAETVRREAYSIITHRRSLAETASKRSSSSFSSDSCGSSILKCYCSNNEFLLMSFTSGERCTLTGTSCPERRAHRIDTPSQSNILC